MISKVTEFRKPAGIIALLFALLLTGCGARASRPDSPLPRASTSLGLELLDEEFPATGPQYAAGAWLVALVHNLEDAAVARCMSARGYPGNAPISASAIARDVAVIGVDNVQFPDLARMAKSGLFVPMVNFAVKGASRVSYARPARSTHSAQRQCALVAGRQMAPITGALAPLQDRWFSIIDQLESSEPVQAAAQGFAACVRRHDAPGTVRSIDAFLAWVTGLQSHAARRSSQLAIERHWARIFIPCASELVSVQEQLQSQRRTAFLRDHYRAIRTALSKVDSAVAALARLAAAPPGLVAGAAAHA